MGNGRWAIGAANRQSPIAYWLEGTIMPTVTDLATTYNLPQYAGPIMMSTDADTPFLDAIGGLAFDDEDLLVASVIFQWGVEELPPAAQPAILEGADASYGEISGTGPFNVVQIFQGAVN